MPGITGSRGYAIGEMSRRTGVNIETIRYYERTGVMPVPDRTPGGNRQYNEVQLKRLSFIKRSRELGFSMREIRAFLNMVDCRDLTCGEVHRITVTHIENVRNRIADLKRLEKALTGMASECSKGDVPECPIIDTLYHVP